MVKVLIKHGADATIKVCPNVHGHRRRAPSISFQDPDDLTVIELAQIAGHDEICAFLQTELH